MFMLRCLAVISTMLTLPVFVFAQVPSSPVPAYNPGFQGQPSMMPAAYGSATPNYGPAATPPFAGPSSGPMMPPAAGPMANPGPIAPMQPTMPAPGSGVSSTFSDFGGPAGAPMGPIDAGGGSYFDGGYAAGDCGSSIGSGAISGACDTGCCGSGGGCGQAKYMSLFGGVSEIDGQRSTSFERDFLINYEDGYALGGAIGKRVGRFFRSELEYTYRSHDPSDSAYFQPLFAAAIDNNPSGNINAHSGMFNLFFDMIVGNGNLVPYVGGGVGVAFLDADIDIAQGSFDGDDTALAFQWMAGLSYRMRPNMELFVEYRYFEVEDPKLNFEGNLPIGQLRPNLITDSEYLTKNVFAGLRFNF